jgi:DUF971 family protein
MSQVIPPPQNIQQIGSELAIQWADGTESYFALEALRRACPCAACSGEPDVTGKVYAPLVTYGPHSFELRTFRAVGGYAIQFVWKDGHDTGLFTFQHLKKLMSHGTE